VKWRFEGVGVSGVLWDHQGKKIPVEFRSRVEVQKFLVPYVENRELQEWEAEELIMAAQVYFFPESEEGRAWFQAMQDHLEKEAIRPRRSLVELLEDLEIARALENFERVDKITAALNAHLRSLGIEIEIPARGAENDRDPRLVYDSDDHPLAGQKLVQSPSQISAQPPKLPGEPADDDWDALFPATKI